MASLIKYLHINLKAGEDMKLSIIVPVYNMAADDKLTFCLDSLIAQTINDYEIIAVDDCSTDDSYAILLQYESRYPEKFRAIHSEVNLHQGGAKNIGLKKAKGDWIGFIDADDWITPDYYKRMIGLAEDRGADIVGCDYTMVDSHTYEVSDIVDANSKDDQTGELDHDKKKSMILDGGSLCVKIFRRQIVLDNKLFFPENIFYEDNAMGNSYMLTGSHFEYIKEPLYYYYQHGASTVHSFSVRRCEDRMEAGRIMISEAKRLGFFDEFYPELEYKFTQLFYVNTLFTYMPCVRPTRVSFVKRMTDELLSFFPDFRENAYYKERTAEEEKRLIDMACSSPLKFYIYYKLLWAYRNCMKKVRGR